MNTKEPRNRQLQIKRFGPGEEALFGHLIRFGESLRYWGDDAKYARWNHAALIASADGSLIEALSCGVVRSPISRYTPTEYFLIHLHDDDADIRDRQQAVAYATYCLGERY